jgi:hypothetical protein
MRFGKPSAWIPIAMSLAAIAVIVARIVIVGTEPEPDEGAAAHTWQLLMAGQMPLIAYNVLKWLPRVFLWQLAAAVAAAAPVFLLGW